MLTDLSKSICRGLEISHQNQQSLGVLRGLRTGGEISVDLSREGGDLSLNLIKAGCGLGI